MHLAHRHLVRAPIVLGTLAIDFLRTRPALGCAKYNHRPAGALRDTMLTRIRFYSLNFADDSIERVGHQFVHLFRLMPLDEIRRVAVAAEEMLSVFMTDPGENAGIGDLVAVEVKDRQNRPVRRRVEEFVGMPARRQRSRFRFAVADDAGNDQIRVVERCSVSMRDGIAEFAALVYRTGRLRRYMARDAAGERELGEQALHPLFVARAVRINLAVGSLGIGIRDQAGPAMPRAGNVDHVEVVLLDHPVQVNVDEIETGCGSPMTQEPRLDVILCEWLLEQRVVVEIDLADRTVV